MRKLNQLLGAGALALILSGGIAAAQPQGGGNMQQFQQQMQERMMDYFRNELAVTNDSEWTALEPRLSKVMRLRLETAFANMPGMIRNMGRGNRNGGGGAQMGGMRGMASFAPPNPEVEALEKAVEDDAPAAEIRAKLQKFRDSRKKKMAELTAAQEDLRKLLSVRQEAVLVSLTMLD